MHSQSLQAGQAKEPRGAKKCSQSLSYRVAVFFRFVAAILGGYVFTSVFISLLAVLLPLNKLDSVLLTTTLSVFFYCCVFIWVFAVKSLKVVWITILLTTSLQLFVLALIKGWL
jgi:hypothetical protein